MDHFYPRRQTSHCFHDCLSLKVCLFIFSLLFVEDLTNLTASDVMNRVNLGYLQGKQVGIITIIPMCLFQFSDCGDVSISDEQNDQQNTLSYVLINPSPDTRLELNDIV